MCDCYTSENKIYSYTVAFGHGLGETLMWTIDVIEKDWLKGKSGSAKIEMELVTEDQNLRQITRDPKEIIKALKEGKPVRTDGGEIDVVLDTRRFYVDYQYAIDIYRYHNGEVEEVLDFYDEKDVRPVKSLADPETARKSGLHTHAQLMSTEGHLNDFEMGLADKLDKDIQKICAGKSEIRPADLIPLVAKVREQANKWFNYANNEKDYYDCSRYDDCHECRFNFYV